ncbi:MAG TPA: response regulator [Dongiaceae bacterium]|nr:response regulator [Dongiaceae bacterium]
MTEKSIVHIVDDEEAVRTSLATLLEINGFVARVYGSGTEFLDRVDPSVPGCALVDLKMPGLDGLGLLRKMADSNIKVPVVMMTGFGEVATAVKAMKAGAADFLEKPLDSEELLTLLNRLLSQAVVTAEVEQRKEQAQARLAKLTERERDVFNGLVIGKTNKAIALDLNISPRTVEIHRAHIMAKLEAGTLSDLVRLGLSLGDRP